jgi:hypothetical protein
MTDFIPGEGYRLDIIAADETTIVDSWAGQIKGDVVAVDGSIMVDVNSGKIYGPMIGNIEDIDGTVKYDADLGVFRTDVIGDVKDVNGNIIVDTDIGVVRASVIGDIISAEGDVIVDATTKIIDADAIHGTFYGDLIGNVSTEGSISGTFVGDFNGTGYGEFFGDFTGNVTGPVSGDVVGNLTGNVTGNLIGNLMVDENTVMISPPDAKHNQYSFLGGLGHPIDNPGDIANGPIVVLGEDRSQSALRGHVQHYDGTPVLMLDILGSPHKAQFYGKFRGPINDAEDKRVLYSNAEGTHLVSGNKKIIVGTVEDMKADEIELRAEQIIMKTPIDNSKPTIAHFTSKGAWDNPLPVQPFDVVYSTSVYAHNGDDYKSAGGFHVIVDPDAKITPESEGIASAFVVTLSNGTDGHRDNPLRLEYKHDGSLKVKTFWANGTTYSERDGMSPKEGMIIFNKNSKKFEGYNGTTWVELG